MVSVRRQDAGRVALVPVALLGGMLGIEALARTLSPTPAPDAVARSSMRRALFEFDAAMGHKPRAGVAVTVWDPEWQTHIRFNRLGVRGPELVPATPPVRRVLMLGDSFTLGVQVDEARTAAQRLAEGLSDTARTEVWNAGVEDYGTKQASRRAEALLEAGHSLDAIVLNFYMGNDLIDNDPARLMSGPDGAMPVDAGRVGSLGVRAILRGTVPQGRSGSGDPVRHRAGSPWHGHACCTNGRSSGKTKHTSAG